MYVNNTGQILLTPQTSVPIHEVWLYRNKEALESVRRGLEQSAHGEVHEMGSFAQCANDEIE